MATCRRRQRWNSCMPGPAISSAWHAHSAILRALSGSSLLIPLYCEVELLRLWHCFTHSGLSHLPCALRRRVWMSRTTLRVSNPALEETQAQDEIFRMVARQVRITRDGCRAVTENEQCTPRWAPIREALELHFFLS
ncbi:hypothetical protein EV121DRAFT_284326 [Schizophyllum commune]